MNKLYPLLAALLVLPACASPGASVGGDRPELELSLQDRMPPDSCSAHWVAGVRGRVVDPTGAPVPEGIVQMCLRLEDGVQLCQSPKPIENGWYAVVIPEEFRCLQQVTLRATRVNQPVSTTFCRTDMTPSYGVLDVPEELVLHDLQTPADRPPMGEETSMRTVTFPSGFAMDVVPSAFEFPDVYDELSAAPVPLDGAPCFTDQAPDLLGLWALGPESGVDPGFAVRIPETTGLPDGTRVELWLVGGTFTLLPGDEVLEEGVFAPVGTGTVRGGMIESDPGSELPYLSWVGYRVAR